MVDRQHELDNGNLSYAWANAFLKALDLRGHDIAPLVVTVTGLNEVDEPREDDCIRQALDNSLQSLGTKLNCSTVASTIFPSSLWNPDRPRRELYDRFERIWPKVAKCPLNRRGHYFRRLTQFDASEPDSNQLEYIIKTFTRKKPNHRRSALQAAILNPKLDHTHSRQQGFPCLHQVAFTPIRDGEMCITGFYGLQYLFERAYGNYLGLCRLGKFMAHQMGLKCTRMTCVASAATLKGNIRKRDLKPLADTIRETLQLDTTTVMEE